MQICINNILTKCLDYHSVATFFGKYVIISVNEHIGPVVNIN